MGSYQCQVASFCFSLISSNSRILFLIAEDCGSPWSSVVLWGLVTSSFFYLTGHQATVPNIRWDAGFVGFHGDHQYYAFPAFLITMNTFAAHFLSTLALPLMLFWPHFRYVSCFLLYVNIIDLFSTPVQAAGHIKIMIYTSIDILQSSSSFYFRGQLLTNFTKSSQNKGQSGDRGEFMFHEDRAKLRAAIFKLILSYLLFHLCKVLRKILLPLI